MIRVHSRNSVVCRKFNKPLPPVVEKKVSRDEQRSGSCLGQTHEGSVNFAVGACFQYLNLYPVTGAAASTSLVVSSNAPGLFGFSRKPIVAELGTNSCNSAE